MSNKIPSFRIYDKNKRKVTSLEHAFFKHHAITKDDYLALQGFTYAGNLYQVVWDDTVHHPIADLQGTDSLLCAVSLQKHDYGYFAVVKPAREHVYG